MKKILALVLAAGMTMTCISPVITMASETVTMQEEKHEIGLSKEVISFGTVVKGSSVEPQTFSIENKGDVPADIIWSQSDLDGIFTLDDLSAKRTEPGQKNEFKLSLKEDGLAPGDYSASIIFKDAADPDNTATTLAVSVKVKKEEPKEPTPTPAEDPEEEAKREEDKKKEATQEEPEETSFEEEEPTEETGSNIFSISTKCTPLDAGYVSGTGSFKKGSHTVLTAYPQKGYAFIGWDYDNQRVTSNLSIEVGNISQDREYTANFKRMTYSIITFTDNKERGSVKGTGTFRLGEDTTILATPNSGYEFTGWYENGKRISKEEEYEVRDINQDRKFKAEFRPIKRLVKTAVYPKDAGEVVGGGKIDQGSDIRLTAKAEKGYVFKAFILNNQILTTKDVYTLKKIDRDLSITAYFEKEKTKTCNIVSGVANKGGAISPSGKLTISEHGTITYNISTENGYAIREVEVDGKKVGAVTSYTFKDITKDHKISVSFVPKKGNEKGVKKDPVISVKEAKKYAVTQLLPATQDDEERISGIITPEMYEKMKEEGTLEDALKIQPQSIVGMEDPEAIEKEAYNYDEAHGLLQALDISRQMAENMLDAGDDALLLENAYREGYLNILIGNQYLEPGKEAEFVESFEKNDTINNMQEFISSALTKEEKLAMCDGSRVVLNVGITRGEDMDEEDQALLKKAGAKIEECIYITVMKQVDDEDAELITDLTKPIELVLRVPEGSRADCVVRLHNKKAEILKDIDENPETITIRTDCFSPYAFARERNFSVVGVIVAASALLIIAAGYIIIRRTK